MHGSSLVGCKDSIVQIGLIWAESLNKVIGADGSIPWHVPGDRMLFKRVTSGHVVVMGRNTFESIGRPLPDRHTIVLTSRYVAGVDTACTIKEAVTKAKDLNLGNVWIAGGEQVYSHTIDLADTLVVTTVNTVVDGDRFSPTIDESSWRVSYVRYPCPDNSWYVTEYHKTGAFPRIPLLSNTFF